MHSITSLAFFHLNVVSCIWERLTSDYFALGHLTQSHTHSPPFFLPGLSPPAPLRRANRRHIRAAGKITWSLHGPRWQHAGRPRSEEPGRSGLPTFHRLLLVCVCEMC